MKSVKAICPWKARSTKSLNITRIMIDLWEE
jgi:hypothetical protein